MRPRVLLVLAAAALAGCSSEPAPPTSSPSANAVAPDPSAHAPRPGATASGPRSAAPGASASTSASAAPAAPGAPPFEGTAGIEERKRDGMKPAILTAVRAAAHDGYERVVFEFAGDAVPGWHVEYVDRPVRRCGSGDPTALAGDGWLEVRMTPAHAHDDRGRPTAGPRELHPGLPVLREIEATCDFEAVVTWVLGVASPNRYRVLELADPPRLVIDVRSDRRR